MSNEYLDRLKWCCAELICYQEYLDVLKKTYNLPDDLPVLPPRHKDVDVLKRLHQMYPQDIHIAKELIKELEKEK